MVSVILVPKSTLLRIGIVASVFFGVFLLAEGALRLGLSERKLREKIAKATGMAVQFEECSVGMLGGIALRGVTATSQNGDSLSAQSVLVRPEVWACLSGGLRFSEVRVENVRFVRMESSSEKKTLPPERGGDVGSKTEENGGNDPQKILKLLRMAKQFAVSHAAVDWMKANGSVRTQMEGVTLQYAETIPGEGRGEISVQRGMWQEMLAVETMQAKLSLKAEKLMLEDLSARCGGGQLMGEGNVCFTEQLPFELKLSAAQVDLDKMSQELPSLRVSGVADGHLQMEGLAQAQQSWVGAGELTVANGMFKGLGVLQMLGQVFQVQELAQLRARQAHAAIRIADKKVSLEGLEIDAGEIQLSAPGVIDFKRALSLDAQISLPDHLISGKALQLFDKRFSPVDGAGRRSLAFHVTGTLDNPRTDLLEKLVGENLGSVVGGALGGLVDQFLGGFLKPRKATKPESKDKKIEETAPTPP